MIITAIILILLGGGATYLYFTARKIKRMPAVAQHQNIKTLTSGNFSQEIKSGIILVDFWASWCMPCKMLAPVLNEVAEAMDGKARVGKLNIEEHQQIAAKYQVRSIPTLIIFRNGKEIDRIIGIKAKEYLVNRLEKALLNK